MWDGFNRTGVGGKVSENAWGYLVDVDGLWGCVGGPVPFYKVNASVPFGCPSEASNITDYRQVS